MTSPSRTVLITGAAKRVGRSIALHLARQGWQIGVHYHRSEVEAVALSHELEALGARCLLLQADLGESFDAEGLFARVTDHLGAPHCLINNAALFERDCLAQLSEQAFARQMQVNLLAPMQLIAAFAKHTTTHQMAGNTIINLGDSAKGWSLSSHFLSYALSKYGLMQLPELLAVELAPHIRINTIALGPTLPGVADTPEMFERLASHAPLGVTSSPDEVCRAVDFILASPSLTGQTIRLSGGLHCHQRGALD